MKNYSDEQLEVMRKISLFSLCIALVLTIAIVVSMFTIKLELNILTIMFFIVITLFAIAILIKSYVTPYLANSLIKKIYINGLKLDYAPTGRIPEKYFIASNFIKRYVKYSSFDFVAGKMENRDFIFSSTVVRSHTSTTMPNELKIIYQGIFGMMDYISKTPVEIIITPDISYKFLNNLTEDIKKTLGENRKVVRLENPEFERLYEVYSEDQVATRKIITPAFMEKMVEFRNSMKKPVTLIYKGNKIYFFIENKFLFNASKLYFKGVNEEIIKEATSFIEMLNNIVISFASEV